MKKNPETDFYQVKLTSEQNVLEIQFNNEVKIEVGHAKMSESR